MPDLMERSRSEPWFNVPIQPLFRPGESFLDHTYLWAVLHLAQYHGMTITLDWVEMEFDILRNKRIPKLRSESGLGVAGLYAAPHLLAVLVSASRTTVFSVAFDVVADIGVDSSSHQHRKM